MLCCAVNLSRHSPQTPNGTPEQKGIKRTVFRLGMRGRLGVGSRCHCRSDRSKKALDEPYGHRTPLSEPNARLDECNGTTMKSTLLWSQRTKCVVPEPIADSSVPGGESAMLQDSALWRACLSRNKSTSPQTEEYQVSEKCKHT